MLVLLLMRCSFLLFEAVNSATIRIKEVTTLSSHSLATHNLRSVRFSLMHFEMFDGAVSFVGTPALVADVGSMEFARVTTSSTVQQRVNLAPFAPARVHVVCRSPTAAAWCLPGCKPRLRLFLENCALRSNCWYRTHLLNLSWCAAACKSSLTFTINVPASRRRRTPSICFGKGRLEENKNRQTQSQKHTRHRKTRRNSFLLLPCTIC